MNCYNDFDFKRANIKVKLKNNDTLYYVYDFKHNATTCNIYLTTEVDKAYDFPVIKLSEYGVAKGDGFYSCKDFLIINENVEYIITLTHEYKSGEKIKTTEKKYLYKPFNKDFLPNHIFTFGKYKGEYIRDIYQEDMNYLLWITNNDDFKQNIKFKINEIIQLYKFYGKVVKMKIINGDINAIREHKDNLFEQVRNIIKTTKRYVNQENTKFLLNEIFIYHPDFKTKIKTIEDIKKIEVNYDIHYSKNKCFYIHFKDGMIDDISWHKCIDNRYEEFYDTL